MPARLNVLGASRSLAFRSRPSIIASYPPRALAAVSRRAFADKKEKEAATGPNQDVLGHVSEEAADLGRITGETTPDLGQGTPVQEVRPPWSSLTWLGGFDDSVLRGKMA